MNKKNSSSKNFPTLSMPERINRIRIISHYNEREKKILTIIILLMILGSILLLDKLLMRPSNPSNNIPPYLLFILSFALCFYIALYTFQLYFLVKTSSNLNINRVFRDKFDRLAENYDPFIFEMNAQINFSIQMQVIVIFVWFSYFILTTTFSPDFINIVFILFKILLVLCPIALISHYSSFSKEINRTELSDQENEINNIISIVMSKTNT